VSAEYLKRTGRTDVSLGAHLAVDPPFVNRVSGYLLLLAGEILVDIARVHFGKDPKHLHGVWRRPGAVTVDPITPFITQVKL
jgi:hypothetical protein